MLIVDTHLDLAWNALQWQRDLTRPVASIRMLEAGMSGKSRGLNTVADLQKISAQLTERGYSVNDVAAIMHGNASRFLLRCFERT